MPSPALNLEGLRSRPGQTIIHQHVRAGLTLYPHNGDPVYPDRPTRARTFNWDPRTSEGAIMSLNTMKTMGAPSGTWQATIKLRKDSDFDITKGHVMDGDWVDIVYLRNGIEFPVMRGVVDSRRQRKMSVGGSTVRIVTLSGRDHGAVFEQPLTWQSFWVQSIGQLFRGLMTDRVGGAIGGSPDEMFELLIEAGLERGSDTNRSGWQLPPALAKLISDPAGVPPYFYDVLEVDTSPARGAYYNEVQLWTQAGQTLHQTLQQWCNPLLNETYYDLAKRKWGDESEGMFAYLRERPFVNSVDGMESAWFSLDRVDLPAWVIRDYDTGADGSQRYTLMELIADFGFGNPSEAAALAAPIWSRGDIQTHGLRPWQQNVQYVAKDGAAQGQWIEERKDWNRLIADWYGPNPYLSSGSLGAGILVPEAKIGMRAKYNTGSEETSEHYYLEGVEHKYSFTREAGHHGETGLSVTRGFRGTDHHYLKMVETVGANFKEVF
jgi:hypothetical protein